MRAIIFSLVLAVLCLPAKGEDWPNWRGPRFDGISKETLPSKLPDTLPIKWRAKVGIGFSSFSVAGDRVFTMGNQEDRDTVWCLDASTGKALWQHL